MEGNESDEPKLRRLSCFYIYQDIDDVPANIDVYAVNGTDEVSDGQHTFGELYEHRAALFIALMKGRLPSSWFAPVHEDGTMFPGGWFIAGTDLGIGQITYHLRMDPWWDVLSSSGVLLLDKAPPYDGHTSSDVIARLVEWVKL